MLPDKIQKAEHASVLPVDMFYDLAVEKLLSTHAQLDRLPKNPFGDDTQSLQGLKSELGLVEHTDFSMFLMGGLEQVGLTALTGAFGIAAHSGLSQALDFGTSFMAERGENDNRQTTRSKFKRAADATPARPAFKRAQNATPRMPATGIMRAAQQKKQMTEYKKALKTRRQLERQMAELKEKIQLLTVYKKQDISYVKMSADGRELTPINGRPRFVFEMENKRQENRMAHERQFNAPAPRMAA